MVKIKIVQDKVPYAHLEIEMTDKEREEAKKIIDKNKVLVDPKTYFHGKK